MVDRVIALFHFNLFGDNRGCVFECGNFGCRTFLFYTERVMCLRSAGWCAFMQAQQEKEQRQKEYEQKRMQRELWKIQNASSERCPICGSVMYMREGKYGKFLGCSNYPSCKGTRKPK